MGSFLVSCGISGLPIHPGNKIALVLLAKNKNQLSFDPADATRYYESTELFKPYIAPIRSTYDDYGCAKNVVDSDTTAMIESMFNVTIKDFVSMATNGNGIYHAYHLLPDTIKEKDTLFTFHGRDDYEKLVDIGFTVISKRIVSFMGFSVEFPLNIPKTSYDVTIKDATNDVIASIKFESTLAKFLNDFSSLTKTYPGIKEEYHDMMTALSELSVMYVLEEVFDAMGEFTRENDTNFAHMVDYPWQELQDLYDDDKQPIAAQDVSSSIRVNMVSLDLQRLVQLPKNHWSKLFDNGNSVINEILLLSSIMSSVNRMFLPALAGSDQGKFAAVRALAETSLAIANMHVRNGR